MPTKVTLIMRAVTGRIRYYPTGQNSEHVLQLTKKKTLSELDLQALKGLGCEVLLIKDSDDKR